MNRDSSAMMREQSPERQLISRLDALLPQSQCRQCGYAGCRPYAEAIAAGAADINQCPPGGDEVARELSTLLGVAYKPVDARFGSTKPPAAARIDEALCIGCTLCIRACPVDAIVGAANMMHTVITSDCTGCELCLAPCPVACIEMVATGAKPMSEERRHAADRARTRFELRALRFANNSSTNAFAPADAKRMTVQRAITRAKLRLARRKDSRQ